MPVLLRVTEQFFEAALGNAVLLFRVQMAFFAHFQALHPSNENTECGCVHDTHTHKHTHTSTHTHTQQVSWVNVAGIL